MGSSNWWKKGRTLKGHRRRRILLGGKEKVGERPRMKRNQVFTVSAPALEMRVLLLGRTAGMSHS